MNCNSSAASKYMQKYNPLAPFSKGDSAKSPLEKGDLGGCLCQKPISLNCYYEFSSFLSFLLMGALSPFANSGQVPTHPYTSYMYTLSRQNSTPLPPPGDRGNHKSLKFLNIKL